MRKQNIIDYIKINDDFNLNLYQEQIYRLSEIPLLISNVGYEKTVERIGDKGIQILFKYFEVDNQSALKIKIEENKQEEFIQLYKKISFRSAIKRGKTNIYIITVLGDD